MALPAPEIVYGAPAVASMDPQSLKDTMCVLQEHGVKILDTASAYPGSEITLGQNDAPKYFSIHTKAPGLRPGTLSRNSILDGIEKSLKDLGVDSIDIYYLHSPDSATRMEDTLSTIQELYAAGKFRRFGISNFLPKDVQMIYDIQLAAKSVLPTAFQGNYNAIARHTEEDLFPLLRKLHISFYAYSPIAGGFLVKDAARLRSKDVEGRFSGETFLGDMYPSLYGKESMYEALDKWGYIARDAGISKAALAYRWVVHHSVLKPEHGDGVIIGSRTVSQLEETLTAIDAGPLDAQIAKAVGDIWNLVKDDAPRDNWNDYLSLQS